MELKSEPFTSFVFSEDISDTKKIIEDLQKGTPLVNFKNRWVCKDGDIKWLSWTATTDPETEILYAVARDITEQLKLEEEERAALEDLYENQQRLNLILENISDGVIVANTNKKVVLANHIANELFGTEDDTKISPNFSEHFELYFPDEKTIFPIQNLPLERALVGEATDDMDVVLWDPKSEKKKRVLLSGRPIIDREKEVVAAVITIKDITRYKKLQEELKKTEQKYRSLIGFRKNDNKKDNNNKEGGETQIEKGKEKENEPDNNPK